ncbi:MAG: metal ABC transporter permease [Betaproteobacteria bacterium]|jgi:zinc/manganese transport system permease protein|nr:metal ABC transporter permease [Betaproteobacteria bacterium]
MNALPELLQILLPALVAGLLIALTHVPLGVRVLERGIVFIDLAVAQIAGLGVIVADRLGFEPKGLAVQAAALTAALLAALALAWTERRWPAVQEAIIGVSFVLAASAALLVLANNPHGAEHLKDLLNGQILWVTPKMLAVAAVVSAFLLALWKIAAGRMRGLEFYLVFACAVTLSVQLVGVYLVFATLIIPALATRNLRRRLAWGYGLAALGYAAGLAASAAFDLPSGATVVWALAAAGIAVGAVGRRALVLRPQIP